MHLQTCFIYELAELETLKTKKAVGEVKGLLSSSIDTFRPPYGRNVIKAPRPSVIVGAVNEDCFLNDSSGSRRFWIIPLPQLEGQKIDIQKVKKEHENICGRLKFLIGELERNPLSLMRIKQNQIK